MCFLLVARCYPEPYRDEYGYGLGVENVWLQLSVSGVCLGWVQQGRNHNIYWGCLVKICSKAISACARS